METVIEDPQASELISSARQGVSLTIDADATEEDVNQTIDEKIAAARARISTTQCLFCSSSSATIEDNLVHMSFAHSFFVPDFEYIADLSGLLTYLGEKVAVGNICLYCGGTGREFRTLEAVRKHMLDKGHCKLAYDTEGERLEVSDFYDFRSSYPDAGERRKKSSKVKENKKLKMEKIGEEEWEDMDGDDGEEADEIVDESESDVDDSEEEEEDLSELEDEYLVSFGETPQQLILPSGTRIGHRSTLRHYSGGGQLVLRRAASEDPDSANAKVRRLLSDKKSALVPRKGNFGAFGGGLEVIKARNAGEARDAGKHVRQYRDQARREHFKTKVGFRHNSQKHFRDPLLQVSLYLRLTDRASADISSSDHLGHSYTLQLSTFVYPHSNSCIMPNVNFVTYKIASS